MVRKRIGAAGAGAGMREPFDEDVARPLVIGAVKLKKHLFDVYPEFRDTEELTAIGMDAISRAHSRFNPKRGQYSTFVYLVVGRRLLSVLRSRSRDARRVEVVAVEQPHAMPSPLDIMLSKEQPEEQELKAWLSSTYRTIRHTATHYLPKQCGRGRRGYTPAQRMTILALKKKLNTSLRGIVDILQQRPELLASMELRQVPCFRAVRDFEESVQKLNPARRLTL
jgi:hypothetical protein